MLIPHRADPAPYLVAALLAWAAPAYAAPADAASRPAPEVAGGATVSIRGRVFEDRNANGARDKGEPGIEGAWIAVVPDTGSVALAAARSNARGQYTLVVPTDGAIESSRLQCVPAPGFYPVGTSVRPWNAAESGRAPDRNDFGLASFRRISLAASNVSCLGTGDLREKDWTGNKTGRARGDVDLVVGANATGTDQLSVWFNRYDANPLFNTVRDYTRIAPNAVLSLAVAPFSTDRSPTRSRADVVIGTRRSSAGNFFTWFTQNTPGNEGYLPSSYAQACRTLDDGDVQAIVAGDISGGPGAEIVVGTRSPEGGRGTIEVWKGDGEPAHTFAFVERYPDPGAARASLGEVTALSRAGVSGSRDRQLVAGTSFGWGGQLVVFGRGGNRARMLMPVWSHEYVSDAVRCLTVVDITDDGKPDLVVGTQSGPGRGHIELWRNDTAGNRVAFTRVRTVPVAGVPLCMAGADFGGLPGPDVAVGFGDDSGFGGRVEIFFCDAGTLPVLGSDPSEGIITGRVPTLATGDFDTIRRSASSRGPSHADLAVGVRTGRRNSELFVFVR